MTDLHISLTLLGTEKTVCRLRALAAVVVSTVAVGLGITVATAAHAADIGDRIIGDITVTTTDNETSTWDLLEIHVALDSQGKPVKAGDTFTIEFPDELTVPEATLTLDGGGQTMAECVAVTRTSTAPGHVTCTMTAEAATRQFVTGELEIKAQVNDQASGESFELKVGAEIIVLKYPGGEVQEPWVRPYPTEYQKWGWQQSDDPSKFAWFVALPSSSFPAGQDITVTDVMSGPTTLIGDPELAITVYLSQDNYENGRLTQTLIPAGETPSVEIAPGYTTATSLTKVSDKEFVLTFTNVLPAGALYIVEYRSTADAGTVGGQKLKNVATANGETTQHEVGYVDYIAGNLNGPGFGGLTISKFVSGDGAELAAGQSFTVTASWTDASGSRSEELAVIADGVGAQLNGVPTGTVVTLGEIMTTQIPGVESYTPTFSSDDPAVVVSDGGATAQVTIGDRTNVSVVLTNDVVPIPAPGRVSVGDYVWGDTNKDGLQDETDVPLEGIKLTLTGPTGEPVTDVDGNLVEPVFTDANGFYEFTNLPILAEGEHYTVTITAPEGYEPTVAGVGDDRAVDSSTGSATSVSLTVDGQRDPTLDFGFVKKTTTPPTTPPVTTPPVTTPPVTTPPVTTPPVTTPPVTTPPVTTPPTTPVAPVVPSTPAKPTLPVTGSETPVWLPLAALGAILIGAFGIGAARRRTEG